MSAKQIIRDGGLIVLPTDTVYGIGANPYRQDAVTALLAAKGRGETMPPPVLAADVEAALSLADPTRLGETGMRAVRRLAETFWPGPLTLIIPTAAPLGWDLSIRGNTVAVRVPNLESTQRLLATTGPLAVTSANKTGEDPALTVQQARAYFGDLVGYYADGGPAPIGVPSTIVDCSVWPARQLRAGALDWEEILSVLEGIN